jgi:ATP phosphoribosyltransferase
VHSLREIGTVLTSTARLVASPAALEDARLGQRITELSTALESVLRAKRKRYLMANVPKAKLEEVREVIPGLSGPTIVEVLDGESWVAAHAVVDADLVYQTIAKLKALGAVGILVTRIERLMP